MRLTKKTHVFRAAIAWLMGLCAQTMTSPPAMAMTVIDAPIEVLIAESDVTIHGHVVSVASWQPDGPRGAIWTQIEVVVWQVIAATPGVVIGERLVFALPGGDVGSLRTIVPGVPRVEVGQEIAAVLSWRRDGWRPIGYGLGIFTVQGGALVRATTSPGAKRTTYALPTPPEHPLGGIPAPATRPAVEVRR